LIPGELEEAIKATAERVQTLSQNLNSTMIQLTRVSTSIEALSGTLTTIMALNGILIILVIIAIAAALRKK